MGKVGLVLIVLALGAACSFRELPPGTSYEDVRREALECERDAALAPLERGGDRSERSEACPRANGFAAPIPGTRF